jgi:hypothetical protein
MRKAFAIIRMDHQMRLVEPKNDSRRPDRRDYCIRAETGTLLPAGSAG